MLKITCSILCYNYGRYLEQAINSCLNQKKSDYELEIIVIDDGSTDNTPEICKKYSHTISYHRSKNEGFAASLTKAIEYAQGDYIFLLDADDYYTTDKIVSVIPYIQEGFLFISDTSQYIDKSGNLISGKAWGSTSTIAVNRTAVLPLLPVENELYFWTLYKLGKGIHINKRCTYYRIHTNNMTDRKIPGKWQIYLAKMTHKLAIRIESMAFIEPLPWNITQQELLNVSNEFKAQAYYNWLESSLELHDLKNSYRYYALMLYWSIKSKKTFTVFNLKMLIKTLLMKPSFPK